jgi:hypothetical protein
MAFSGALCSPARPNLIVCQNFFAVVLASINRVSISIYHSNANGQIKVNKINYATQTVAAFILVL